MKYELTPNAQIWPRALNTDIGGSPDAIYLIVNDFGSPSGEGLDFINGMSFLERFYMVYDVGNSRQPSPRRNILTLRSKMKYELTPNAQIWPRALNTDIGGSPDAIYLIVNDFGSPSGEGLDFINGMSFLERFYMVYDVGNSRAALAQTKYTYAEIKNEV